MATPGDCKAMPSKPFARATIAGGSVTLNAWAPGLISGGPARGLLERLPEGTTLADLEIDRRPEGNELIVRFVTPARAEAEEALVAWAQTVGYRRIWLPGRVVEPESDAGLAGRAAVECPTCGARWSDDSPDFIAATRDRGWFPAACCACGGSLPEWHAEDETGADGGPAPAPYAEAEAGAS